MQYAQHTWDVVAAYSGASVTKLQWLNAGRNGTSIGDPAPVPFIHDMINDAADKTPDNNGIIVLTNSDIGIVGTFYKDVTVACQKHGAIFCHRWDFPKLDFAPRIWTREDVAKGKWYIGADAFAFTKQWWLDHKHDLPDFVLGRECWDWVLRVLIQETGGIELEKSIFHEKHESTWKKGRLYQPGNVYNRSYARAWLTLRNLPLKEIEHAPFNKVVWPVIVPSIKAAPAIPAVQPIDVLITLGQGSKWDNNELRYCLRSLEKHAKNIGNVFVVGCDPGFLNPATVGVYPRADVGGTNKEHRIAEQIAWAADKLPMTESFLWVNDDTFFLGDTDITAYPYYHFQTLQDKWGRTKQGGYRVALMQTDAQLRGRNLPTHNFEIHLPILYTRKGFSQLGHWLDLSSKVPCGMTFRSIYCNVLGIKPGPDYTDMKIGTAVTSEELAMKARGRHAFSIGDGLSPEAKTYFDKLYPTKSKYEA